MEEWKDIPGFFGKYQVSSQGNVRSLNYRNTGKSKNLVPLQGHNGLTQVKLSMNGKKSTHYITRLVSDMFLERKRTDTSYVIHINGDKSDDRLENLRYKTHAEFIAQHN